MRNNNTANRNNSGGGDSHPRNSNSNDNQNDRRKQNQQQRQNNNNNNQQKQQSQQHNQTHHHQQQQQQQPQQQMHQQNVGGQYQQQQNQPYRERSNNRDRSDQRYQNAHPDSSMSRDPSNYQSNLGSVKFTPGLSTKELPPIQTKPEPEKKFTGRCRLFVGGLPQNITEEKLRKLFSPFGEIGELYYSPKSYFAFIKMDTKQNAEAARDALDCTLYENRTLRVRLAAHSAAIKIKNLSHQVTNELLAYAFRYFGEIERAVVIVDDKGRSTGEGIVEYARKQSAIIAVKKCQQDCFLLTASPQPVHVELYDQQDDEEGMTEKSINKHTNEFKEQREVGPRFPDQGSFEHAFALRWKELYAIEQQKRERLEQEIQEARKNLQDQIEYSRLEHDTIQLRNRLQQLEDDRLKLQQLKEQTMTGAQVRDEQRRQQDMLIRQREEELLRRQQLADSMNGLNQQHIAMQQHHQQQQQQQQQQSFQNQQQPQQQQAAQNDAQYRMQQPSMPEMSSHVPTSEPVDVQQPQQGQADSSRNPDSDSPIPFSMLGATINTQPRTFADVAMMGLNPPFIPVQQPMGLSQAPMFTTFVPQPTHIDSNFMQAAQNSEQYNRHMSGSNSGRGQKYNSGSQQRYQHNNNNNNVGSSNDSRPRKRSRY